MTDQNEYTKFDGEEIVRAEVREMAENYDLTKVDPYDAIHEIVDGATPIYWHTCFDWCASDPNIGQLDVDYTPDNVTPAAIAQIACYEWLYEIAHEEYEATQAGEN
jgi:hypothetical protein